jgi:hypothetical protein
MPVLRHQLIILQRKVRGRAHLTNNDRWFFVQMYRWFPSIMKVLTIIEPETLVRWHRAGFRRYWRWKSRSRGGRPQMDLELRTLIRQMSMENLLWGAPRIHGELLKLAFSVAQSTVATRTWSSDEGRPARDGGPFCETTRRTLPPWICSCPDYWLQTTLRLRDCAASSQRSRLDQRHNQPDSGMGCTQITGAFPWDGAPRYMIRDRDRIYGTVVTRRLRAMGIRDKPIAPSSPWQNGFAERLIGSIRRECLDHIIIFSEAHLCRILKSYADYYNPVS